MEELLQMVSELFTALFYLIAAIIYFFFYGLVIIVFWPFFLLRWFIVGIARDIKNLD